MEFCDAQRERETKGEIQRLDKSNSNGNTLVECYSIIPEYVCQASLFCFSSKGHIRTNNNSSSESQNKFYFFAGFSVSLRNQTDSMLESTNCYFCYFFICAVICSIFNSFCCISTSIFQSSHYVFILLNELSRVVENDVPFCIGCGP